MIVLPNGWIFLTKLLAILPIPKTPWIISFAICRLTDRLASRVVRQLHARPPHARSDKGLAVRYTSQDRQEKQNGKVCSRFGHRVRGIGYIAIVPSELVDSTVVVPRAAQREYSNV